MSGNKIFLVVLVLVSSAVYVLAREEKTVGVSLHGVNHTDETFSFYLRDPENPEMISGGSGLIDPYGASGITCCAVLPREWHPGLKLKIHTTHYLEKQSEGSTIPEIKEVIEAEVPRYVDGKPGEIWVLRKADGKVEVVSSDYQPDHPNWPGAIKGWPVPSIEYRRERWELHRKLKTHEVQIFTEALEELETSPLTQTREDWESTKSHSPYRLSGFSGPDDPLYIAERRIRYTEALESSKRDLQHIMEAKP
jgi:hypothetical protein